MKVHRKPINTIAGTNARQRRRYLRLLSATAAKPATSVAVASESWPKLFSSNGASKRITAHWRTLMTVGAAMAALAVHSAAATATAGSGDPKHVYDGDQAFSLGSGGFLMWIFLEGFV
jgi:hypothetical protein